MSYLKPLASAAIFFAFTGQSAVADVSLAQIKAAGTPQELLALGGKKLSPEEFQLIIVGRQLDEGTWLWFVNPDGSHSSRAKDGSWEDVGGRWEMQDDQYCRSSPTAPARVCSTAYLIGDQLRMTRPTGALAPWSVTVPRIIMRQDSEKPAITTKFDGLYRPAGNSGKDWSCNPAFIGNFTGPFFIGGGYIDAYENGCALSNPRHASNDNTTTFDAACAGEGDGYYEILSITKIASGVRVSRAGRTENWQTCPVHDDVADEAIPENLHLTYHGDWTSYFGMGWIEASTTDRAGNMIRFSCGPNQNQLFDGGIVLMFAGKVSVPGPVNFDVDGTVFSMMLKGTEGDVDLDCQNCGDKFGFLWSAVVGGKRLSVWTANGQNAEFSLSGSRTAMSHDKCRRGEKAY